MIPVFALILTAAGSSERFNAGGGESVKKEFLKIDGHTVLYRAALPFFEIPSLAAVVVTCKEGCEDEAVVAMEDLADTTVPMLFTAGGATRSESVRNALEKLSILPIDIEYVAIQDGARPYTTTELAIRTFAHAVQAGGAIPALPVTDSVRRINGRGEIVECVDRRGLVRVQTPQIFSFPGLLESYRSCDLSSATDDAEIFIRGGNTCIVVEGDEKNIKITYKEDIPDADRQIEEYLAERDKGRKDGEAMRMFQRFVNSVPGDGQE